MPKIDHRWSLILNSVATFITFHVFRALILFPGQSRPIFALTPLGESRLLKGETWESEKVIPQPGLGICTRASWKWLKTKNNSGAYLGFKWQQQRHMGNFQLDEIFPTRRIFLCHIISYFPFFNNISTLVISCRKPLFLILSLPRLNPVSSLNPTQNGTSASSTAAGIKN